MGDAVASRDASASKALFVTRCLRAVKSFAGLSFIHG